MSNPSPSKTNTGNPSSSIRVTGIPPQPTPPTIKETRYRSTDPVVKLLGNLEAAIEEHKMQWVIDLRTDLHSEIMLAGHYHPKYRTDLYNRLDRIDSKIRSNNWTSEFNRLCSRNRLTALLPSRPDTPIMEQYHILGLIGLIDEGVESYLICAFSNEYTGQARESHESAKDTVEGRKRVRDMAEATFDITEEWARADGEGWLVGTPIIQALLRPLPDPNQF